MKTTGGGARTAFYRSENERAYSKERREAFLLVRVDDFASWARDFELVPPLAY